MGKVEPYSGARSTHDASGRERVLGDVASDVAEVEDLRAAGVDAAQRGAFVAAALVFAAGDWRT